MPSPWVDTVWVKLRRSTEDLVAAGFAMAVATGKLDEAEGWVAVAMYSARRQDDRLPRHSGQGLWADATRYPHC